MADESKHVQESPPAVVFPIDYRAEASAPAANSNPSVEPTANTGSTSPCIWKDTHMPPHCDSLDGPVVTAARQALDASDVNVVLPYVGEEAEAEVRAAFDLTLRARAHDGAAREAADLYFFNTVVRLHRAGEGAPFTGLKPAGLDVGPVIPLAESAIASDDPDALAGFLSDAVRAEVAARFRAVQESRAGAENDVASARRFVDASLGLQVWAHHLNKAIHAPAHEHRSA
jgi:hypothetical protein